MNLLRLITMLILCLVAFAITHIANGASYDISQSEAELQPYMSSYFTISGDKFTHFSADQVATIPRDIWQEKKFQAGKIALEKGVNWYSLSLQNNSDAIRSLYLSVGNTFQLSSVQVYAEQVSGQLEERHTQLSNSNLWYSNIVVPARTDVQFFVKVVSDIDQTTPMMVVDHQLFIENYSNQQLRNGLAIGGLLSLSLVFILLYVASKDKVIGVLAGYFVCRAMMLSVLLGGHLFYFYPHNPELRLFEFPLLAIISSIFYLWLAYALFRINKLSRFLHHTIVRISWMLFAFLPVSLMLPSSVNIMICALVLSLILLFLAGVGFYLHKLKQRLALLFSVVMLIQVTFTIIIMLGFYFNIEAFEDRETLHIASFVLNVLLIIFLVSRKYYYQIQDQNIIQKQAFENAISSKKAQDDLLALQQENQEVLEQKVQQRTLELNIALNELEVANQELEQKNTLDELTGLYNRRFYDQKILAEYRRSKRNLTPLSLVLIDIDHFKKVNDNYGHLAGDQCLSWLSNTIKQKLKRSTDLGCRYGGEEFCLILPDTEQQGAVAFAEEIRQQIEHAQFNYQSTPIAITISCGVSTYIQQKSAQPEHLFFAADSALYQAKRAGRNQVKVQDITDQLILQEQNND